MESDLLWLDEMTAEELQQAIAWTSLKAERAGYRSDEIEADLGILIDALDARIAYEKA